MEGFLLDGLLTRRNANSYLGAKAVHPVTSRLVTPTPHGYPRLQGWHNFGALENFDVQSTRFVTACYIMSFIAYHDNDRPSTSTIARWINTNASRVRQIVAALGRAGLLNSTLGGRGGISLGRHPAQINLSDIFDAVSEKETLLFNIDNPFSDWKDRCKVHDTLTQLRTDLADDFKKRLSLILLSDLYCPPVIPSVAARKYLSKKVKASNSG